MSPAALSETRSGHDVLVQQAEHLPLLPAQVGVAQFKRQGAPLAASLRDGAARFDGEWELANRALQSARAAARRQLRLDVQMRCPGGEPCSVDRIRFGLSLLRQLPAFIGALAATCRAKTGWTAAGLGLDATATPFAARGMHFVNGRFYDEKAAPRGQNDRSPPTIPAHWWCPFPWCRTRCAVLVEMSISESRFRALVRRGPRVYRPTTNRHVGK